MVFAGDTLRVPSANPWFRATRHIAEHYHVNQPQTASSRRSFDEALTVPVAASSPPTQSVPS